MDTDLQARFDRLESALNALVESLASYNPSPTAAASLVAADDHLTQGLDRLSSHQRNNHQIQSLRAIVGTLDDRVKNTLLQLAQMRKDLRALDLRSEARPAREVHHDQLLSYAQQISRFTVPPTYKPPLPPAIDDATFAQQPTPIDVVRSSATPQPHNTSFGPGGALNAASSPPPPPTPTQPSHLISRVEPEGKAEGKAMASLPMAVRAWLQPPDFDMPFMPWPTDETIRKGALASIDSGDKGVDPSQGFAEGLEPGSNLSS